MLNTRQPDALSAISDSMLTESLGAWTAINTSTLTYWLSALNRRATPFDLVNDIATWNLTMADRERPEWAHDSTFVKEWPLGRLRDYSAADADPNMIATVILPPQAGHDSSIVDFSEDQSQIMVGRNSGCERICTLEWVGATQDTKDAGIDDYMAMLRETADLLGGRINLVGDCQGGWLATIFTALHPEQVNSLTIAGAPVDFSAGDGLMKDWLDVLAPGADMTYFRSAVAANGGMLPGRFLLDGFKALQPFNELTRSLGLLANLHDPQHVERYRKFEDWFQWTQPLPGAFYLWIVENLFVRNLLVTGELEVEGRTVDLSRISCPLFLLAGKTDHITPAAQVWALADHVSTPDDQIERQLAESGHLGLFMSHSALSEHWPVIFEGIAALSAPTAKPAATTTAKKAPQEKPAAKKAPAAKTPATKASAAKTTSKKSPAATASGSAGSAAQTDGTPTHEG